MRLEDEKQRSSFNDLQIEKVIQEQRQKEFNEKQRYFQNMKQEQRDFEIEEFHNNSLPLFQMDIWFLLTTIYSLIMCGIGAFTGYYGIAISCLIACICMIFIGKCSYRKYTEPQITNTILWNLSQSLFDFIDIKIPFETLNNKDRLIDLSTVLCCIVFLICKPGFILYGIAMTLMLLSIIIAFSMKDVPLIYSRARVIVIFLFIGLILKSIFYSIFDGILYFDAMNIVLLNIFNMIKIYTDDLEIYHI